MKYHRLKSIHDLLTAKSYPSMSRLIEELEVSGRQVARNLKELATLMEVEVQWCPRRLGYHYRKMPSRSLAVAAGLAPSSLDLQEVVMEAIGSGDALLVSVGREDADIVIPVDLSVQDGRLVLVAVVFHGRKVRSYPLAKIHLEKLDPMTLRLPKRELQRLQSALKAARESGLRRAAEERWFDA